MKRVGDGRSTGPGRFAAVALALIVAAVCIRLGFWQLDRLETRRAFNAEIAQAMALPPVDLDASTFAQLLRDPASFSYRVATVTGTFDHAEEVLLRGRSHEGRPGVHVVTPLRLDPAHTILVNRGWLPSPDAVTVDPRPFQVSGGTPVKGILVWVPDLPESETPVVVTSGGGETITFRRLDHAERVEATGAELPRLYLQQLPASADPDLPRPVQAPELDEGSHLGYAIQWFSFALIALLGLAIVGFRRGAGASPSGFERPLAAPPVSDA